MTEAGTLTRDRNLPPLRVPGDTRPVQLTERQKLACALRILAKDDYRQNLAGHISVADPDNESFVVNPWGMWWDEVRASDICRVSMDGEVLEGAWDVTPAVFIHTELHRVRPDARVVVHNHPYYGTFLATIGRLPQVADQTGCMFDGEMALYNEYTGLVDGQQLGQALARGVGDATAALLVNHGVVVVGRTIEEATYRAVSFERVCRLAYDALMSGTEAVPIAPEVRAMLQRSFKEGQSSASYFRGAAQLLLQTHPEVLE